uniref:Uncharacterized protein n=1 Tax=Anguilla anguilla TaxID=7936 RepID=A0A0E9U8L7_ANGAN
MPSLGEKTLYSVNATVEKCLYAIAAFRSNLYYAYIKNFRQSRSICIVPS